MRNWTNLTKLRHVEDLSTQVLAQYRCKVEGELTAPIDVEEIAKGLFGLEVKRFTLGSRRSNTGGILTGRYILLDKEDHPHYQRYSVGHELGHALLNQMNQTPASGNQRPLNGDSLTATLAFEHGSPQEEDFCDRFAEALLMPLDLLEKSLIRGQQIDAVTIAAAAEVFDVSRVAMLHRVTNLLQHNPTEFAHIADYTSLDLLNAILWNERRYIEQQRRMQPVHQEDDVLSASKGVTPDTRDRHSVDTASEESYRTKTIVPGVLSPEHILQKPFVIEFAGSPRAGKDTQIGLLAEYGSNVRGYSVRVRPETYTALRGENLPAFANFLLGSFNYTISGLLELYGESAIDVEILNRALFDHLAYLKFYHELGYVNKRDMRSLGDVFRYRLWVGLEDVVVLLVTDPKVTLARAAQLEAIIRNSARKHDQTTIVKPANVVNTEGLKLLNRCYSETLEKYGTYFRRVIPIYDDGTLSKEDIFSQILEQVLHELPPARNPLGQDSFTQRLFSDKTQGDASAYQLSLFGFRNEL